MCQGIPTLSAGNATCKLLAQWTLCAFRSHPTYEDALHKGSENARKQKNPVQGSFGSSWLDAHMSTFSCPYLQFLKSVSNVDAAAGW